MNQSKNYLLLMDPREEILRLQEAALNCFYSGEIITMNSSAGALDLLKSKGHPEMIIVDSVIVSENDSHFYHDLESEKINVPIIATAMAPINELLMTRYPSVTAVIERFMTASSFTYLMKGLIKTPFATPTHIPIKTSVLQRMGIGLFDLYLKLSATNHVKILHKGEVFFDSDAQRLADKGVFELYIKFEDSNEFLKYLEDQILHGTSDSVENVVLTLENIETFERVAKYLKWGPDVLEAAQKTVEQALKILSKNQKIMSVLKNKLNEPSEAYARHVGLLTYFVCAFSSSLGLMGESGQIKLALAALIHDASVENKYYENIKEWNKRASNPTDKSPETLKYRMHPFEASKIVRSLDSVLPDVDQIILQHHEVKDGTGFPRAMDSGRIGHLPALFIIVEDLVEFIGNGENLETSITDFIMWGGAYYDRGHFKKIFTAFEKGLKI